MIVRDYDDEAFDDEDDDEGGGNDPDDSDLTMPCPECREPVFDDAELCPNCGRDLSRDEAPRRKPWWVVLGVVACLMMVTWWIWHP